eukprot:scaffold1229_cov400-Prasinococcus_capsulatus_cf.AAC.8
MPAGRDSIDGSTTPVRPGASRWRQEQRLHNAGARHSGRVSWHRPRRDRLEGILLLTISVVPPRRE